MSTTLFLLNNLLKQMVICTINERWKISINTQRQFESLLREKRAVKHFLLSCLLLFTLLASRCEQNGFILWLWGMFSIHKVKFPSLYLRKSSDFLPVGGEHAGCYLKHRRERQVNVPFLTLLLSWQVTSLSHFSSRRRKSPYFAALQMSYDICLVKVWEVL